MHNNMNISSSPLSKKNHENNTMNNKYLMNH